MLGGIHVRHADVFTVVDPERVLRGRYLYISLIPAFGFNEVTEWLPFASGNSGRGKFVHTSIDHSELSFTNCCGSGKKANWL